MPEEMAHMYLKTLFRSELMTFDRHLNGAARYNT